jgi:hypothetical protein
MTPTDAAACRHHHEAVVVSSAGRFLHEMPLAQRPGLYIEQCTDVTRLLEQGVRWR